MFLYVFVSQVNNATSPMHCPLCARVDPPMFETIGEPYNEDTVEYVF